MPQTVESFAAHAASADLPAIAQSMYQGLAPYSVREREGILLQLLQLHLSGVEPKPGKPVEVDNEAGTTPPVVVPPKQTEPATETPPEEAPIVVWDGGRELVYARTYNGVRYAISASGDFKSRGWLRETGQLTAEQIAQYADADPRLAGPVDPVVTETPQPGQTPITTPPVTTTDTKSEAGAGYRVVYGWCSNRKVLDVEARLVDGVVKLRNKANPWAPNPLAYEVNGGIRIEETKQLRRSLDEWESLPGEPILIHLFEGADTTKDWLLRSTSTIHAEASLTVYLTTAHA